MKYNYSLLRIPISLLTVLLSFNFAWAQTTVSGTVTDGEDGSPLPGVNVLVQGTTTGAITDFDGNFSINVPSSESVLVFSYIGYLKQEITVGNQTTINVAMPLDVQSLAEVVVVGYGTQEKKEITSAVVSLDAKEFNQGNINNPSQLLQGKVPGLSVSGKGSDPNGRPAIRLRGISTIGANTEPLIVIDGVIGASLDNVDPNDIESVNVLKDGSAAAIYGSRGSSGVILVTTKSGKAGQVKVNYNVYGAMDTKARLLPILNRDEFIALGGNELSDGSTDWIDEVTRDAFSQVHNLSVSGGTESTTFRIAANVRDIDGILEKSGFEQVNFRANLNHSAINDRLNFTFNFSTTQRNQNNSFPEALRYAQLYNPTAPVFDAEGNYFQVVVFDNFNPRGIIDLNQNVGKRKTFNYNGKVDFEVIDGLTVTANIAQQLGSGIDGEYYPGTSFYRGFNRSGLAIRRAEDRTFTLFESYATYMKRFGNLNMTLSAGYSYQQEQFEDFRVEVGGIPVDDVGFNALEWAAEIRQDNRLSLESAGNESEIVAQFARANFSWDEAVFLNASVRREGSTKLGEDNQYGIFPAVGLGVNLNRYLEIPALNQLKVRAGYGVTGALPRDIGLSTPTYNVNYTEVDGQLVPNFTQARAANPDLKWEVKSEINFGIDLSTSDDKLTASVDIYTRNISDFIIERAVDPGEFGASTRFENAGELKTNGFEVALNYKAIETADFSWNPGIVMSSYNSVLESFVQEEQMQAELGAPGLNGTFMVRVKEGEEIGQIWGPVFEGVADDGGIVYQDVNGDGQLKTGQGDALADDGDFALLGNGLPDLELGFTNQIRYKRWDLNAFFRGAFGHSLVNTARNFYEPRVPGSINSYNRINTELAIDDLEVAAFHSLYVEKADFFKLDNITLGYNFDVSNVSWLSNFRAYANVQNAFIITGYTGIDPEPALQDFGAVDNGGRPAINPNVLAPGIDRRNNYFLTRTFTVGLSASF